MNGHDHHRRKEDDEMDGERELLSHQVLSDTSSDAESLESDDGATEADYQRPWADEPPDDDDPDDHDYDDHDDHDNDDDATRVTKTRTCARKRSIPNASDNGTGSKRSKADKKSRPAQRDCARRKIFSKVHALSCQCENWLSRCVSMSLLRTESLLTSKLVPALRSCGHELATAYENYHFHDGSSKNKRLLIKMARKFSAKAKELGLNAESTSLKPTRAKTMRASDLSSAKKTTTPSTSTSATAKPTPVSTTTNPLPSYVESTTAGAASLRQSAKSVDRVLVRLTALEANFSTLKAEFVTRMARLETRVDELITATSTIHHGMREQSRTTQDHLAVRTARSDTRRTQYDQQQAEPTPVQPSRPRGWEYQSILPRRYRDFPAQSRAAPANTGGWRPSELVGINSKGLCESVRGASVDILHFE
ncbi:uncharacterized protein B0I36DRAFT_412935 [Microdochium trichocladiopsis]|uniref:Uncharacterized protein n=1 Tax=Microdochium trichocladiopsis TaxID=1682393 RepID=A0A9P8Y0E4_9PEZI|nr:uncharacterized protein B0I36DRAFT_412935 [Microdochium trichocladiopsis]KAH7027508.1 hypothetical protein B0I36DRAFT_412935 [Microdochium trichocladiopsis]